MLFSTNSHLSDKSRNFASLGVKAVKAGIALIAASLLPASPAAAQSNPVQTLHNFTGNTITFANGKTGPDGEYSTAFTVDHQGNKFFACPLGGLNKYGGIFELTADGKYYDLVDFRDDINCYSLTVDPLGNLYGVCEIGGAYSEGGSFWRLTTGGVFGVLHSFGGTTTNSNGKLGPDGITPTQVTRDANGNFFGVCTSGGAFDPDNDGGAGIAWEYTSNGVYKDLHDFGGTIVRANRTTGFDGKDPNSVAFDSSGNLFGTTYKFPQNADGGNLWKITPSGVFADLHDFGSDTDPSTGVKFSDIESGDAVIDTKGNVFGASAYYDRALWEYTTAGNFRLVNQYYYQSSGMAFDSRGNLYGTTGESLTWQITPDGVANFISPSGGTSLSFDSSGLLYCLTSGSVSTLEIGPWPTNLSSSAPFGSLGGDPQTGIVCLGLPTPTDLVVDLSSNDKKLPIPATVTVPAGKQTATFPIKTTASYTNEFGAFTATAGGYRVSTPIYAVGIQIYSIAVPSSMIAGTSSTGTVSLDGPALSGGLVISLTSSDPQVTVPTSVTIPAGQSSAQFSITTKSATAAATFQIKASDAYTSYYSDGISLLPTSITGLTVAPTEAPGTNVFMATATIAAAAPSGGVPIQVSDNSIFAQCPVSVTVPAGKTSVTFPIPTTAVNSKIPVLLFCTTNLNSSGQVTQTAPFTLDVLPTVAKLAISPDEGPSGSTFTGTFTLSGPAPSVGTTVTLASNSSYVSPPSTVTVPGGATTVSFPVATSGVPKATNVLLRATTGSVSQAIYFTIGAAPAPPLSSLTVSPGEALGGTTFTGTVTLASPAPYPISISTATNSSFVSIPAIVVIPTGSTSATYSIKTHVVYNKISVLLKATLGSTTKTQYVTLDASPLPTTLSSVTVSPTEAQGGTTFTATATLSGPAPTGGYVITISSNSGYLSPPATVSVPAGSTSVTFSIPSTVVSSSVSALLKASDGSTTKTIYVTLDP